MGKWETSAGAKEGGSDPRQGSGGGRFAAGTPEDVAALYTWANIQGARYRDFSSSRRRYREEVRARAAEGLRERGGTQGDSGGLPQTALSESAAWFEADEQPAEVPGEGEGVDPGRENAAWLRESSTRSAMRELGSDGGSRGLNEQQDEAPKSFREELEMRFRRAAAEAGERVSERVSDRAPERSSGSRSGRAPGTVGWTSGSHGAAAGRASGRSGGTGDLLGSGMWERVDDPAEEPLLAEIHRGSVAPLPMESRDEPEDRAASGSVRVWSAGALFDDEAAHEEEYAGPAWLYGADSGVRRTRTRTMISGARYGASTGVQEQMRRGGSGRWAALRGIVGEGGGEARATQLGDPGERRPPLLVLFSLAGGVGRTSLLATLGRVLSASGERVALGDAAPYSPLPFYFGARDVTPGAKRAFAPPEGSHDAPILVVNYEIAPRGGDGNEQRQLVGEVLRNGSDSHRILLDLPAGAEWLTRRMTTLGSTVVVPLIPDMNSVIGLETVERYFEGMVDADGNRVLPFYLLNQFDGSLALHLDVREVLRRQLGERLLSFVIRRAPVVSEALAEGMTVVDYAPESPVARDFQDVAAWLRTVSPPAMAGMRNLRSGGR
ncbi:MAG: hypothetical protein M3O02_06630 [Acidobacteriota bacterium]|nr:hypothetical protein [Acidobacteriota bacterium]